MIPVEFRILRLAGQRMSNPLHQWQTRELTLAADLTRQIGANNDEKSPSRMADVLNLALLYFIGSGVFRDRRG
jgi:hypothetical protein